MAIAAIMGNPVRRWLAKGEFRITALHLLLLGGPLGLLTGVVASTGPLTVPLFTFQAFGALSPEVLLQGLGVGATLMAGSFIGRFVVLRLSQQAYRSIIDGLMACSGLSLLWAALR